jgi:hypothetical protein
MIAGKNFQGALAHDSGLIRNCAQAVGFPPAIHWHLKVNNSSSFVSYTKSVAGD